MSNVFNSLDDIFEETERQQENKFEYSKLNVEQIFYPFQLKVGQSADVVFLGNDVLGRYEHNVRTTTKTGGTRYTSVACLGEDCPLCDAATSEGAIGKRRLMTYFNVMPLGGFEVYDYETKGIVELENPNLVLIATSGTLELIKEFRGKNKGKLHGMQLTMKRTGKDKAPRVGDVIYPSGKHTDDEILEINPRALDSMYSFDKITTTLSYDDAKNYVRLVMGGKTNRPASGGNSGGNQTRRAQTPEQTISW